MKSFLQFILVYLISFQVYAEQAPYNMHELLLHYNLAAHVKITSHAQDHFRVKVLSVLDKRRSGIVNGDYLKVNYDFNVVCPPSFSQKYAKEHREALAFLSYHNGKWGLTQGKIAFLEDGLASVIFHEEGYEFKAPIELWKENLIEYARHFSEDKEGRIQLKLSSDQFQTKNLTALTRLQYVRYYHKDHKSLDQYKHLHVSELIEFLEEESQSLKRGHDEVYQFASVSPISDSMMLKINNQLTEIIRTEHPQLKQIGISGNNYYSLIFEKNGQISEIEILRAIAPEISKEIEAFFLNHKQWKPALNEKGEAIRFKQTLVLPFKEG